MAILTEYFAATEAELARLDVRTGPARSITADAAPRLVPASKPSLFGKMRGQKPTAPRVEMPQLTVDSDFDMLPMRGIDPVVNMATLEEIVTGRDAIEDHPGWRGRNSDRTGDTRVSASCPPRP